MIKDIFKTNRPVMILGLTILIGCAGALFIGALFAICAAFAIILAAVFMLIFAKDNFKTKLCVAMMLVAAAASLCWFAHRDSQYRDLLSLEGCEVEVNGTVEEIEYTSSAKRRYIVRGSVKSDEFTADNVCFALYCRSTTSIYLFDEISCTVSLYDGDGEYEQRLVSSGELRLTGHINQLNDIRSAEKYDFHMFITNMRMRISEGLRRILPGYRGNLLSEIVVGISGITDSDDIYEDFRAAGISHILVISGTHLMIAAQAVSVLLEAFGLNKKWTAALSVIFILGYSLLAGMGVSVVRAAIMMLFSIAAKLLGRRSDGPIAITAAAAVIVLAKPLSLLTASMWLSFSAALGIMLLSAPISSAIAKIFRKVPFKRLINAVGGVLGGSIAAWIFVTPASILLFSEFSLYSVIVNFVVSPLLTPLILLGILTGLLSLINPVFLPAKIFGMLAGWLLSLLRTVTKVAASLPFARIYAGDRFVQVWVIASVAIFLIVILLRPRHNAKYLRLAGGVCAFALVVSVAVNAVLMRDTVSLTVSSLYNGSAVTVSYRGNAVTIAQLDGISDANLLSSRIKESGNIRNSAVILESGEANEAAKLLEKTDYDAAVLNSELIDDDMLYNFDNSKLYASESGMMVNTAGNMICAHKLSDGAWIIDAKYANILYITEDFDIEDISAEDTDVDILILGDGVIAANADRLRNALAVTASRGGVVNGERQILEEAESIDIFLNSGKTYSAMVRR